MLKLYDMTTKEVASTQLSSSPKKILLGWLDSSAYALLENGEVAVLSLYPNPVIQQRLESINESHDLIDIAVGDCLLGLRSDGVVVGIDFSCIGGAFDLTKQGSASFK